MDVEAARRARQQAFKHDLAEAYTDEEACPPEWAELSQQIRDARDAIASMLASAVDTLATEPDIRRALAARESADRRLRELVRQTNEKIRRLNFIAPIARVQQMPIDADEVVRPLMRTARRPTA